MPQLSVMRFPPKGKINLFVKKKSSQDGTFGVFPLRFFLIALFPFCLLCMQLKHGGARPASFYFDMYGTVTTTKFTDIKLFFKKNYNATNAGQRRIYSGPWVKSLL